MEHGREQGQLRNKKTCSLVSKPTPPPPFTANANTVLSLLRKVIDSTVDTVHPLLDYSLTVSLWKLVEAKLTIYFTKYKK